MSATDTPVVKKQQFIFDDLLLLVIMLVLAGCGLIYEFLLSHYAARVLGAAEQAIFAVFTIMITAMGIGAFAAGRIRCPFSGFAWLELLIALMGAIAILLTAAAITATTVLPNLIAFTYGVADVHPDGGIIRLLQRAAVWLPYLLAFFLGILIGAEIPLIARVREAIHKTRLEHNTGTIYGADYIGAGIGATLFVIFMMRLEVSYAAALVAGANLLMGVLFFIRYRQHIQAWPWLACGHFLATVVVLLVGFNGPRWEAAMEDMLYKDTVIFQTHTRYQHVVVTRRIMDPAIAPVYALYINGHSQFSSRDERIYHALLTYPAMAASSRHGKILIIGGGDGLALRDVLRWQPDNVTLIDLDIELVDFFSHPRRQQGAVINAPLLELNEHALTDPRVQLMLGDAYNRVDELIRSGRYFDTIIIDLPDPNHPDIGKLYSTRFYQKLARLLSPDGALVTQSTSPYHAREAFLSIGRTLAAAGFAHVEQYHANVPSFGEWGWTIAVPAGRPVSQRLRQLPQLPIDDGWSTKEWLLAAFAFPKGFFDEQQLININRLNSTVLYDYYRRGWRRENDS